MDYTVERWINQGAGANPVIDTLMKGVAAGAVVLFLGLVVLWFACGCVTASRRHRVGAVAAVVAAGAALALNQLIGLVVNRPRPYIDHPGVHVLLARSSDSSFPSDHAAAAFAIATVAMRVQWRLGLAAVVLAGLVGCARVYVGLHYPGDVLAGAAVGGVMGGLLAGPLVVVPALVAGAGDAILRRLRLHPASASS